MKVRRFLAVDDCGTVINPLVVEGQIHGGLTEGFAIAFMQEIQYDAEGNNLNTNFTDYLVPTSLETPHWETANTVTPSPHHPIGAKGVGESPERRAARRRSSTRWSMRLSPLGVRHLEMPVTRDKVWRAIRDAEARRSRRREAEHRREASSTPDRSASPPDADTVWTFVNDPDKVGHCLPGRDLT